MVQRLPRGTSPPVVEEDLHRPTDLPGELQLAAESPEGRPGRLASAPGQGRAPGIRCCCCPDLGCWRGRVPGDSPTGEDGELGALPASRSRSPRASRTARPRWARSRSLLGVECGEKGRLNALEEGVDASLRCAPTAVRRLRGDARAPVGRRVACLCGSALLPRALSNTHNTCGHEKSTGMQA